MISEYETPRVASPDEKDLSAEEIAKFVREDLPSLADRLVNELAKRLDIGIGLYIITTGLDIFSAHSLPAFCQTLLSNHNTCTQCRSCHSPVDQVIGSGWRICYGGVEFISTNFIIENIGPATLFAGFYQGASEDVSHVRSEFIAKYGASLPAGEQKRLDALYSSLRLESMSRLQLDAMMQVLVAFVRTAIDQRLSDIARNRGEALAKQMFLHEASHGLASVESTLFGLGALLSPYLDEFAAEDKEDARQFLGTMKREYQIHRMGLLNLLHYYHPAAYAEIQRSLVAVCNPVEILFDLLPLYEPLAQARDVRIEQKLERWSEIPRVRLDRAAIARAFHNVLWNAVKYSYRSVAGSTDRYISVSCRPLYNPGDKGQGKEFAIQVENYGLGIKADEISKVTKPAFRGEAAIKEKVLGSGLGLFETERILRSHGGRLRITSKESHAGTYVTRVYLILPYRTILA